MCLIHPFFFQNSIDNFQCIFFSLVPLFIEKNIFVPTDVLSFEHIQWLLLSSETFLLKKSFKGPTRESMKGRCPDVKSSPFEQTRWLPSRLLRLSFRSFKSYVPFIHTLVLIILLFLLWKINEYTLFYTWMRFYFKHTRVRLKVLGLAQRWRCYQSIFFCVIGIHLRKQMPSFTLLGRIVIFGRVLKVDVLCTSLKLINKNIMRFSCFGGLSPTVIMCRFVTLNEM